VDRLPINVTRKDREGRITFVNQPFCDLVGSSRESLINKTDYDLFPRELADKYRRDDAMVFATGQSFHAIEQNRSGGITRFFEVWKVPVRSSDGPVVESQAVFWDVTDREENREALARERDLLRTLMDSLPDLIYVKDAEGRFVTVNSAFREFCKIRSLEDVIGATTDDFVPPELVPQIRDEDSIVLAGGTPLIDREQEVRVSGSDIRTFAIFKVPLRDADGNIVGLVGIERDITNRKRNEEALRSARQAADAANRAKSDFLASMSHEIRTPLNGVVGITDLLIAGVPSEDQRNYLEIVRDSGESLMYLVNDILDFSKIEAGQLSLESTAVDLHDVLSGAMKPLALRAHEKDLELCCDIDPSIPSSVFADPVRLRQIVTNLVGNAIKFTSDGEVTLKVIKLKQEPDEVELQFSVKDTGIGIPADKVDHIFEAFAQADSSTTRIFGGTGLGLAIASRLVDVMGGQLDCDSKPGLGTTFHFRVTLRVAEKRETTDDHQRFRGCRVLVAEPNETNRQIIVRLLQSCSMDVVAVEAIDDAIAELKESSHVGTPFQYIVADSLLNLPKHFATDAKSGVPAVIELVTTSSPEMRSAASPPSVVARLIKPVNRSELVRAFRPASETNNESDVPAEGALTDDIPPLNVLLAEDSPVNQMLAETILKMENHNVTLVTTGREAMEACKEKDFDLVLMDVQMPEMDGIDATKAIRNSEEGTGQHLLILAMTANAMAEDRDACLKAGMDGYISKPMRVDALRTAISELLQSRG
jgi:PAS domain S-box-containing protein